MLAKILALRHGFTCTVLFSLNPNDGTIDPNNHDNMPGLGNHGQLRETVMKVHALSRLHPDAGEIDLGHGRT